MQYLLVKCWFLVFKQIGYSLWSRNHSLEGCKNYIFPVSNDLFVQIRLKQSRGGKYTSLQQVSKNIHYITIMKLNAASLHPQA